MLVIQHIVTVWTKASRGGSEAIKRNSVPEALPVIFAKASDFGLLHTIRYDELCNFTPSEQYQNLDKKISYDFPCLQVLPAKDDNIVVEYRWDSWKGGAPLRDSARKIFTVGLEEWITIRWNGRFVNHDSGQWRYEKHVINAASGTLSRQMFRNSEPAQRGDFTELLL